MDENWVNGSPQRVMIIYDHEQGVVRGLSLMVMPMIQCWSQYCLTYLSTTWMKGQVSGSSGQYPRVLCSPSGGPWEAGEMDRGLWNSVKANAGLCTWGRINSYTSTDLDMTCWKEALWRRSWGSWRTTGSLWASQLNPASKSIQSYSVITLCFTQQDIWFLTGGTLLLVVSI